MGGALMKAAAAAIGGARLGLTDADAERAAEVAASIGAAALASNSEAVAKGKFAVLAVKPQVLDAVLAEIAPACAARLASGDAAVLVSIVAGASIERIRARLAAAHPDAPWERQPIVRSMPNTPALVAKGMLALAAGPAVSAAEMDELEAIFGASGLTDRVEEKYMDAVTALSGSGPAFVYLFIEALADGGVRAGLARDKALRYAARTVLGAAAMVEETGQHPGVLKDAVCSPAGTTIAGVAALEDRGFRGAAMAAVDAAFKRAKELG
jgi:pyrroline-5-carboxylate reductase